MILLDNVTMELTAPGAAFTVLRGASIALPGDERLVVLGHEGSGKTTLIRLLAGILQPTSGTVVRQGRVSFPVGFVGGFKRKLSVIENIRHAARLYGTDIDEAVAFVSAMAGLDAELRQPYEGLPAQARVKLAYAVSYGLVFDTYLVDNMLGSGDADFRALCLAVFQERMKTGGCIMTTKLVNVARRFATAAAVLDRGVLTLYPDVEEAIDSFTRIDVRGRPRRLASLPDAGGLQDATQED